MHPDDTPREGADEAPSLASMPYEIPVIRMVEIAPGVFAPPTDCAIGEFRVLIQNHTDEIPPEHTLPLPPPE